MLRSAALLISFLPISSFAGAADSHLYGPIGTSYLSVIDPSNSAARVLLTSSIQGFSPDYVYVSPDGSKLFEVSISDSSPAGFSIAAFEKNSGKPLQTFTTTYPPEAQFLSDVPFAVSPDGTYLAVATCSSDYEGTCEQGNVEVFDISTGAKVGLISAGVNQVFGIAISPDNKTAYFTSSEQFICPNCEAAPLPESAITAFNLATLKIEKNLSLSSSLMAGNLVVAPSGKVAYVGTILGGTSLLAVSLSDLTIQKEVKVIGAIDVGLSANGAVLVATASEYNSSLDNDTVTVLDPSTLAIRGTVAIPYLSDSGFALDESGENVYLGNSFNSAIYQVSTSALTLARTIPSLDQFDLTLINSGQTLCALQNVFQDGSSAGVFPEGLAQPTRVLETEANGLLAVSPDGALLYSELPLGGVEAISTATGAVQKTFLTGLGIASLALSPDAKTLYAAGFDYTGVEMPPSYLWIVDIASGATLHQIPLPPTASMTLNSLLLALSPDGSTLVVNIPNLPLIVFNTASAEIVGYIEAVAGNTAAIDPTGQRVYFQDLSNGRTQTEIASLTTFQNAGSLDSPGAAIAFSPTQSVVYVADGEASVTAFSTTNFLPIQSVPIVTSGPQALAVTPDGRYLYAVGIYLTTGAFQPGAVVNTSSFSSRPFDGVYQVVAH